MYARAFIFGAIGALLGVLLRIWATTGFNADLLTQNPDIPGVLEFGIGGALLGFIVCWFL